MGNTFMTALNIYNVRHLKDIIIPLSKTECKSLILTGKNRSEHLRTHRGTDRDLMFDWNNLFLCCPHCTEYMLRKKELKESGNVFKSR